MMMIKQGMVDCFAHLVAGVEETDCRHNFPSSSHSLGGKIESRISSVSSLASGLLDEGGADFGLGDVDGSSLSMRTGLL